MRLPSTARLGVYAVALGILVYLPVYFWAGTRTLVPLDIPVSLAPGHIRTGNFRINFDADFSVQVRVPYGASHECQSVDDLRTKRLTSIGKLTIHSSRPPNDNLTPGPFLGAFHAKPGDYSLDVEVVSSTQHLDRCGPRLVIEANPSEYYELNDLLSFCFPLCAFSVLVGLVLLLVSITIRFQPESFAKLSLNVWSLGGPIPSTKPAKKIRQWNTLLLSAGILATIAAIVLLGAPKPTALEQNYDDLTAELQVAAFFLSGSGLSLLVAYRWAVVPTRTNAPTLALASTERPLAWGVTGLRFQRSSDRCGWSKNPLFNIPQIALVCALCLLTWLLPTWIVYSASEWTRRQGLYVSAVREGVAPMSVGAELAAPLIQIRTDGRLYLNYKPTTWQQLPDDLEHALRGMPTRVVYFDGETDILFMDAARAISIIQNAGAKTILVTPRSRVAR